MCADDDRQANYFTEGLKNSICTATDADCICTNETLMANIQACSLGSCTVIEGLQSQNATATLCHWEVRDKSIVAPIATAVTGALALAFIIIRVGDCIAKNEFKWADLCAVLAFYTWVTQVWYIPAIILTKVAIVCFFMHIFPGPRLRLLFRETVIHCFLFMISTFIIEILAYIPVEEAWSRWKGESTALCYDNTSFWWAHSVINIATDLWLIGLPIPMLLGHQLKTRKKIYLVLIFSIGIVITVISIIRFSGLLKYSTTSNLTRKADPRPGRWLLGSRAQSNRCVQDSNVMVAAYSVIECNVSIMWCCMPAHLSTLRRILSTIFGSTNRSHNCNYNDALFADRNRIQKSVTHKVTYTTPDRPEDDVVELVDRSENYPRRKW
ncbi:unnamed protein product [Penicillium discolor]